MVSIFHFLCFWSLPPFLLILSLYSSSLLSLGGRGSGTLGKGVICRLRLVSFLVCLLFFSFCPSAPPWVGGVLAWSFRFIFLFFGPSVSFPSVPVVLLGQAGFCCQVFTFFLFWSLLFFSFCPSAPLLFFPWVGGVLARWAKVSSAASGLCRSSFASFPSPSVPLLLFGWAGFRCQVFTFFSQSLSEHVPWAQTKFGIHDVSLQFTHWLR